MVISSNIGVSHLYSHVCMRSVLLAQQNEKVSLADSNQGYISQDLNGVHYTSIVRLEDTCKGFRRSLHDHEYHTRCVMSLLGLLDTCQEYMICMVRPIDTSHGYT